MNNEANRSIFSGMQILINQKWETKQAIVVEDGLIRAIIAEEMIQHHFPAEHYQFPADHYLSPGLIDLHIHGAEGCDVMDGTQEALTKISHALAKEGITGFLATTMTADNPKIETVLATIHAMDNDHLAAAILGVHLEGPFIAKEKIGAQLARSIQLPNPDLVKHWQTHAGGNIKIMTFAPELAGAMELIEILHHLNIIASIGHTNATYDETIKAINAGCTQATHLFNAMRGLQQREPGAAGALLLSKDITAELIVDGVHLHPAIVDMVFRLKGKDRLLLVTDAIRAKCCAATYTDTYELGGQQVVVNNNVVTLADGTLAGSILKLPEAIKNMMQFTKCSLADAIYMASMSPARSLKLADQKGSIEIGKHADLVVFNPNIDVMLTMREGKEIYRK